jgi:hypothetical protein
MGDLMAYARTVRTRTVAGKTFRCSNRTYWHLRWTMFVLRLRFPKARLNIYQGCYHTGVAASAGTHDYDCVFDVWITGGVLGRDHWRAQHFLRAHGWAAWFRHTGTWAPRSAWHIHMISLPPGLSSNPTPFEIGKAYERLDIKVGRFIDGGYTTRGHVDASSQVDDYYAHALGLAGQHRAGDDPSWHPKYISRRVFHRSLWFRRTA